MTTHKVDFSKLLPHGQIKSCVRDGALDMTSAYALPYAHCKPGLKNSHYMELPDRYELPLRIDVMLKIDSPAFHLEIGKGFASFGVYSQDNRRMDDICEPKMKINQFNGGITMNAFNEISLIYSYMEMQILVNGEERYYSKSEPYMKSRLLAEMNAEGFSIRIACDKNVKLTIASMKITEYIGIAPIIRPIKIESYAGAASNASGKTALKPTFEELLAALPQNMAAEVVSLDAWLRALKPVKFRRNIDIRSNKITYVASEYGFSYAIYPDGGMLYHQLQWYIITNRKPELWGRKDDRMEDLLNRIAETDPAFAERMFGNLYECVNGRPAGCLAKTAYEFNGRCKVFCHGSMRLKMNAQDFSDAKRFISAFNEMILEDAARALTIGNPD
jgi:hypothetical protein